MPPQDQLSFAVDNLLYGRAIKWSELSRTVEAVLAHGAREIKVKLLLLEKGFPKGTRSRSASDERASYTDIHRIPGAIVGEVHGRFGRDKKEIIAGKFLAVQNPEVPLVWAVVTDAGTDFLNRPFRRFLRSIWPKPVAPIFRTGQLQELLRLLESRSTVRNMRVTQLGYRATIRSEGANKAVERDRRWTDVTVEEAFSEALEAGQWVTDVTASFDENGFRHSFVKIGRYGVFTVEHHASTTLDSLLNPAARIAAGWYEFLRDRERAPKTQYHSRPFNIEFNHPALASREQLSGFTHAIGSIPSVTCTVLHGNPYFHAVMVDFQDGSTYETLVLRDNAVTIIPQGRTSVAALQRLCSRVFSNFREGELRELDQT